MAVMEFLEKNYLDTTTMVKVDSNTGLSSYLFDRNVGMPYVTDGYTTNTSTIISIELDATTTISNILLQNHNLKDFRLFYDSVTANSIDIVSSNSATSSYFDFSTISAKTIQLQMDEAQTVDTEKSVGEFIITEKLLAFPRNPNSQLYKPKIDRTQVKHIMPDGGIVLFNIKNKYKAKIGLKYITSSFYASLLDIYEDADPLYFIPFPTTTAWDGLAYAVVWSGDFDFTFGDNAKNTYSGNINIEETISG